MEELLEDEIWSVVDALGPGAGIVGTGFALKHSRLIRRAVFLLLVLVFRIVAVRTHIVVDVDLAEELVEEMLRPDSTMNVL